jgi:hypothetical protein
MRSLRDISCLLVAAMIVGSAGRCNAAIAREISWKQVSDDRRYVLVMVSSKTVDDDAHYLDEPQAAEVQTIRAAYTAMWTVSQRWINDAVVDNSVPRHRSGIYRPRW